MPAVGAIVHFLDVGGVAVANAAGIEADLAGLQAGAPSDAKLVTEAGRGVQQPPHRLRQDGADGVGVLDGSAPDTFTREAFRYWLMLGFVSSVDPPGRSRSCTRELRGSRRPALDLRAPLPARAQLLRAAADPRRSSSRSTSADYCTA